MFSRIINHLVKRSKPFRKLNEEISYIGRYFEENPPEVSIGGKSAFLLPYFWQDHIQQEIFRTKNYFEIAELEAIDEYLPQNAVILDVGSNIGNHTLYWCNERGAARIHAFEPVPATFEQLRANVARNGLEERVTLHNTGLGKERGTASPVSINRRNTGATRLRTDTSGALELRALDEVELDVDRIDLIKIDVEGFELDTLSGARETIRKFRPVMSIEAVGDNLAKVDTFLDDFGYVRGRKVGWSTHVYTPSPQG